WKIETSDKWKLYWLGITTERSDTRPAVVPLTLLQRCRCVVHFAPLDFTKIRRQSRLTTLN
ncbi:hypothetical protein M514_09875, partial [Trichuris suis]